MPATPESLHAFVNYCQQYLQGKERKDAQLFLDKFFIAFGHQGLKQAGAECEELVPGGSRKGNTGYADLFWRRDRLASLLIEMKSRGENLNKHYGQAWEYSLRLKPSPKYVILCNFDEFWIYDFNVQIDTPLDKIRLVELPDRSDAFTFMEFTAELPKFRNKQVEVTERAARKVGELFQKLKNRGERSNEFNALDAQRFALQCVIAMFAQYRGMLPPELFMSCIKDCLNGESTYDILYNGLFREMNTEGITPYGRYKGVDYFNGGLFSVIPRIHLNREELEYLEAAAREDWSQVRPAIFGNIFESTENEQLRHTHGVHFTSENDIMKIIRPTISKYWEDKIEAANTSKELEALQLEMQSYRVLDPACGSGNFLYMAYQELKQNEQILLDKLASTQESPQSRIGFVNPLQFYGIDNNPFAVELARVTLLIARKVAIDKLGLIENFLPLDTLDRNIVQGDALFMSWFKADAIIGNPPFQSKNKMQQEYGADYVSKLRARYPEVPGRADYCVYWFRRTHDELPTNGRAGLVGTNTIRQNYSRVGGLDYIVKNGGTIIEAVSSQVWSGDAVVHVSIANWIKGEQQGKKKLYTQLGDDRNSPWEVIELDWISSALSRAFDVTQAIPLNSNIKSAACYQGQTHGHDGFMLTPAEAAAMIRQAASNAEVIFPYLIGDDLLSHPIPLPQRYVIDFHPRGLHEASSYAAPFQRVRELVLKTREAAAIEEEQRNEKARRDNPKAKVNQHHRNFLKKWWLLSYPRTELIQKLDTLPRYIGCSRVTKRPIFEFIDSSIRPSDALQVFSLSDDYSFGILQSDIHGAWFTESCSTLKRDFRYTSNTVFDTFTWPQEPTLAQVKDVAEAARNLRTLRRQVMAKRQWSLRELYKRLDQPEAKSIREANSKLDIAVRLAYGMGVDEDPIRFLFYLNSEAARRETAEESVVIPGLPPIVEDPSEFITDDCVRMI